MALATLSVALLMALALGRREAGVVLLAVPVTLALTLFVFMLFGYTLNRITLFALIFSIGILVDDAIVVVENIVRHLRLPSSRGRPLARIAIEATDEVGNPTILATFAVIAAIVPMGFVGGLMGPYMRPIPVGASAAMLFSLLVAFAISPWAARRLFRGAGAGTPGHGEGERSRLAVLYRKAMTPLVSDGGRRSRAIFFGVIAALLARGRRARSPRRRHREDAALRQQERVPGRRRLSRRHDPRDDAPRPLGDGGRPGAAAGGRRDRGLRRRRRPLQLQRPRAALLPAVGAAPGGRPGLSRPEGKAPPLLPRHRPRRPHAARADRPPVRRARQGRRGAAGAARAPDARRRDLRPGRRGPPRSGAAGARRVPADRRRRRRRLVPREPAREGRLPARPREGGPLRDPRGGRRGDAASRPVVAMRPARSTFPECASGFPCVVTLPDERRHDLSALGALVGGGLRTAASCRFRRSGASNTSRPRPRSTTRTSSRSST